MGTTARAAVLAAAASALLARPCGAQHAACGLSQLQGHLETVQEECCANGRPGRQVSGEETITCVFSADDHVAYVYYDEEDLSGRVDNWGSGAGGRKTVEFQGRPGGVLALGVWDNEDGRSGSMSFVSRPSVSFLFAAATLSLSFRPFSPISPTPDVVRRKFTVTARMRRAPTTS